MLKELNTPLHNSARSNSKRIGEKPTVRLTCKRVILFVYSVVSEKKCADAAREPVLIGRVGSELQQIISQCLVSDADSWVSLLSLW